MHFKPTLSQLIIINNRKYNGVKMENFLDIHPDPANFLIITKLNYNLSNLLPFDFGIKNVINLDMIDEYDINKIDLIILHEYNWSIIEVNLIKNYLSKNQGTFIVRISNNKISSNDPLIKLVNSTYYVDTYLNYETYYEEFTNKLIESIELMGLGGCDFADVRRQIGNGGICEFSQATILDGENQAIRAIKAALCYQEKPVLGVLVTITHSHHFPLRDYEQVNDFIKENLPINCQYELCHRIPANDDLYAPMCVTVFINKFEN